MGLVPARIPVAYLPWHIFSFNLSCLNSGMTSRRASPTENMKLVKDSNSFLVLTASLIGLLVTGALLESLPQAWSSRVMEGAFIILLLLMLLSLRTLSLSFRWGFVLVGFMFVAAVFRNLRPHWMLDAVFILSLLAFYQAAFWVVSHRVLMTSSTDVSQIVGSIAMYLLLGMSWSALYGLVLLFEPNAIRGIPDQSWIENFSYCTYFSFITLTTLGYGDVVPQLAIVRVLAFLEAVTGVFFMAVVVASLLNSLKRKR